MPEMLAMLPQDRQQKSLDSLFAGKTADFLTNVIGPEGASALSMGLIPLKGTDPAAAKPGTSPPRSAPAPPHPTRSAA